MRLLLLLALLCPLISAQTHKVISHLDATEAPTTKPCKTGTSPPGTCAVGECFIDTDATAEKQFHSCTSTNTWTVPVGTILASDIAGLSPSVTGAYDFSGASSTHPNKSGASAPASCTVGDTFYDTNANLQGASLRCSTTDNFTSIAPALCNPSGGTDSYSCATANEALFTGLAIIFDPDVNNTGACTVDIDGGGALAAKAIKILSSGAQADPSNNDIDADGMYLLIYDGTVFIAYDLEPSGGGGASAYSDLSDHVLTRTDSDTLSVAAGAGPQFSGKSCADTVAASVDVSSGTGTIWVYIRSDCTLYAGSDVSLTAASNLTIEAVAAYPNGAYLIGTWGVTAGALDVAGGTDARGEAIFSPVAGTNISIVPVSGQTTFSVPNVSGYAQLVSLFDPTNAAVFYEHFMSGGTADEEIGSHNWSSATTITETDGEPDHPGVVRMTTTATINTIRYLTTGGGATSDWRAWDLHDGANYETFTLWASIKPMNNTVMELRVGLVDDADATDGGPGYYFELDTAVSANWYAVTDDGTNTSTDTGVAVADDTWVDFKIVGDGTDIKFYIDGALEATHTTDRYQDPVRAFFQIENLEAVAKLVEADYFVLILDR